MTNLWNLFYKYTIKSNIMIAVIIAILNIYNKIIASCHWRIHTLNISFGKQCKQAYIMV